MFVEGVFRGSRVRVWDAAADLLTPTAALVVPGRAPVDPQARIVLPGQDGPGWTAADDVLNGSAYSDAELDHGYAVLELIGWRRRIAALPPGPELHAAVQARPDDMSGPGRSTLGGWPVVDPPYSHPAAVLDGIVARRRIMASLAAAEVTDLDLLSRTYPGVSQFLPLEVGQALHISDGEAGRLLDRAQRLVRCLPQTLAALGAGRIGVAQAETIIGATATTTAQVAGRVEAAVLPTAGTRTAEQMQRSCAYRVGRYDPDGVTRRHHAAVADRHCSRHALPDGMARFTLTSSAQDVATMWEAVTALADAAATPGDPRNLGQRRVDALVDVCADILSRGGYRNTRTPRPPTPPAADPGDHAPVRPPRWGRPVRTRRTRLDHRRPGPPDRRRRRTPPAGPATPPPGPSLTTGTPCTGHPDTLAEFVTARDRTCPIPGCSHPAVRGHLDHIHPAKPDPDTGKPTAGATSADNLCAPDPHHHLAKDGMGYTLSRSPDGSYHLRSPLGRTTHRPPERLMPPPDYPPTDQHDRPAAAPADNHVSSTAAAPADADADAAGVPGSTTGTSRAPHEPRRVRQRVRRPWPAPSDDARPTDPSTTSISRGSSSCPASSATRAGETGVARTAMRLPTRASTFHPWSPSVLTVIVTAGCLAARHARAGGTAPSGGRGSG